MDKKDCTIKEMKLFSGSSNTILAGKIGNELGIQVSPLEIFIFPDQERRVRVETDVIDEDCVIIQSTSTPADTYYMELFFIADALNRAGARSITLVMPYVGYQRQDHIFRSGEAVSMQVITKTLEAVGIDKIITFDLHSLKIPEFFHIPVTHLSALPLFAQEIKKQGWGRLDSVLVSPDMGGIRRIKLISDMLTQMPYAVIEKNRDLASGTVDMVDIKGEINHRALIVDDMISSGKTVVKAAELLKDKGVQEIYVFVTHAVFSTDAPKILQNSLIDRIYATDSVLVSEDKQFPKLKIISLSTMIADRIKQGL